MNQAQTFADRGISTDGTVMGAPRLILLAEGAALFAASIAAFASVGGSWWWFAILFLVPDAAMLGYFHSKRTGAVIYNIAHSTLLPLATIAAGWSLNSHLAVTVGLIWLAHVGFDRMLGFGLKYGDAFKHTHLGTPFQR